MKSKTKRKQIENKYEGLQVSVD